MVRSRKNRVSPWTLFFILLSAVLAVLLYRASTTPGTRQAPASEARTPLSRISPGKSPTLPLRPRKTPREVPDIAERRSPPPPSSSTLPAVAILIDDLGNDRAAADRIARWPFAVSGAVLPALPGSGDAARRLSRSGKDVLLHLPMEPKGYPGVRPGPGVILLSQTDQEIEAALQSDLESVPGAIGVNNHMGSAATADPRVMRAVAGVLARHGLFFVDSRTTQATVALDAVRQAGVRAASRRVFLDDVQTESAIETSLSLLIEKARAEGSAIAIGHPYPATLAVLDRELPKLSQRGVRLVRVSELVE